MPLIPLKLPPGVFRNGTRYGTKGRWIGANRVRWHNNAMRPIGGWEMKKKADGSDADNIGSVTSIARDGHAWRSNSKEQFVVWGSSTKLQWQKADGTAEDISAGSGLTPGDTQVTPNVGYGSGLYGRGAYGLSPAVPDATIGDVARWSFSTWGENLLAMPDWEGKIYEWIPGTGNTIAPIANAPTGITDFIVTQDRIVMTIGSPSELRKVQWSDQEDNTSWTPAVTNQAGSYVLPGDGRVLGIYRLRNQTLILTETDAWMATYIGPPYIYSFVQVGEACAPLHRKAVSILPNGAAAWFGSQTFWIYDGSVKAAPCDLIDFVVADISGINTSKMFSWNNSTFDEVWFHYPSNRSSNIDPSDPASIECEFYVSWSWNTGAWSQGRMQRSAAVGDGVYNDPQMVGWYGTSYWHEQQGRQYADGYPAEAVSGPIELGEGGKNIVIRGVYPDSQRGNWTHPNDSHNTTTQQGVVKFRFETRAMPTGSRIISDEYTYVSDNEQPIPTRVMGRDAMIHVYGDDTAENLWEWGTFRLDVTSGGSR